MRWCRDKPPLEFVMVGLLKLSGKQQRHGEEGGSMSLLNLFINLISRHGPEWDGFVPFPIGILNLERTGYYLAISS